MYAADLLTKDQLEDVHRQLWTELTNNLKLNNVVVSTALFFGASIDTYLFVV